MQQETLDESHVPVGLFIFDSMSLFHYVATDVEVKSLLPITTSMELAGLNKNKGLIIVKRSSALFKSKPKTKPLSSVGT